MGAEIWERRFPWDHYTSIPQNPMHKWDKSSSPPQASKLTKGTFKSSPSPPFIWKCDMTLPWYPPSKTSTFFLPVCLTAVDIAKILASVPELANRTSSMEGNRDVKWDARVVSARVWAPSYKHINVMSIMIDWLHTDLKSVVESLFDSIYKDRMALSIYAAREIRHTAGRNQWDDCILPRDITTHKSTYSCPSRSVIFTPWPFWMHRGKGWMKIDERVLPPGRCREAAWCAS